MSSIQITGNEDNIVITSMKDRTLTINSTVFIIPHHVANKGNSVTIVNGKIYINGYEFNRKTKEFNRTLTALYHLFF